MLCLMRSLKASMTIFVSSVNLESSCDGVDQGKFLRDLDRIQAGWRTFVDLIPSLHLGQQFDLSAICSEGLKDNGTLSDCGRVPDLATSDCQEVLSIASSEHKGDERHP